jgi:ubiquinone/menaquinone biosynthesis C-methylase UbiE
VQRHAFDDLAADYDVAFTRTAVGRALRDVVWEHVDGSFRSCRRILELGCGTGEDAVRLAQRGAEIVATDASSGMLSVAREKAQRAGCSGRIEFHCVAMENLAGALDARPFDGVLSNFGAINCVGDLPSLVLDLSSRVSIGGKLVWVIMGRTVPLEWASHLLRGNWRKAWRRLAPGGASWRGLTISYPRVDDVRQILRPWFTIDRVAPLGLFLPPTDAAGWLERSPRALAALAGVERRAHHCPSLASWSDHYIVEATRR